MFEAAVSMRFLQKRSKFGKVRRTASNVHQRFLLPMCRAQATVATVAAAPFASFSGRTEKEGPRGLSACLTFCFYESNLQLTALKVFIEKSYI